MSRAWEIRVPATSANLGSLFDVAAVALDLWNTFEVRPASQWSLDMDGPEATSVDVERNPFRLAVEDTWAAVASGPVPSLAVRVHCGVPMARGLGSSTTAVVAGVLAALRAAGADWTPVEVMRAVGRLEGHADNAAAAVFGGFVLVPDPGRPAVPLPAPPDGCAVVAWPSGQLDTRASRAALPPAVPRADAVFNLGRGALLAAALATGRPEWLRWATEDRLHEPVRQAAIPHLVPARRAALEAGAWCCTLSGSGPAVLALSPASCAEAVQRAVVDALEQTGPGARGLIARVAAGVQQADL